MLHLAQVDDVKVVDVLVDLTPTLPAVLVPAPMTHQRLRLRLHPRLHDGVTGEHTCAG